MKKYNFYIRNFSYIKIFYIVKKIYIVKKVKFNIVNLAYTIIFIVEKDSSYEKRALFSWQHFFFNFSRSLWLYLNNDDISIIIEALK